MLCILIERYTIKSQNIKLYWNDYYYLKQTFKKPHLGPINLYIG